MDAILKLENIKKTYRTKEINYFVLKGISFNVKKGEFVSIMGPSGSGKTTLLNIISGFIPADEGKVLLGDKDLLKANKDLLAELRQSEMGFVFQDFMLIDALTTSENIMLPQIIINKKKEEIAEKTNYLIKMLGIEDIADKYPNEISGGQKQRIAIARALANNPKIILADEPTGNLDSKSAQSVLEAFFIIRKEIRATIVMVTHDAVSASYSDRIIALKDGKVVEELQKKDNQRNYLDQIFSFLGKVNGVSNELK
ncbi:ABC transporter ATP-binding protein [Lachnotalea glycerini]|uniref:ABC transporter ATP-binding protein n=1 Tax=Lachnotalea glycerini TaxID=1763509 RepID=UPI0026B5274F|nr:ABC transporter ATP-binding protein [Lachnotalea glycerini]